MDGIWSTVAICAVLALICIFAVWSYIKKLKTGCCGGGGDEIKRIRPADSNAAHYPYARKITIEGMSCKNCAMRVENAFNRQDGYYATVDLRHRCALVRTKQPVGDDDLRRVVLRTGYQPVSIGPADT